MKKIVFICLSVLVLVGCIGFSAVAEDEATRVYVTISDDNGELVLIHEEITVTDTDGDSLLTINDALYLAHETKYDGGAAEGYKSEKTDFGLSLIKLWGAENGGSYGYYLNNASSISLLDTVKNGDSISAFVYTDLTAWSDQFCYFDKSAVSAKAGESITLTLSMPTFDDQWNTVIKPVEGAVITINGEKTAFKTNSEGKVTFTVEKDGKLIISAESETLNLVSPACVASVTAVKQPEQNNGEENKNETDDTQKPTAPVTGEHSADVLLAVALVSLSGALFAKKKVYEK